MNVEKNAERIKCIPMKSLDEPKRQQSVCRIRMPVGVQRKSGYAGRVVHEQHCTSGD